jgi:hypothetical protein
MARLDKENLQRLAAALSELNARLRGVDADKLGIDPADSSTLESGASFTMDTDAGADDYDQLRSRALKADAGGIAVWVVDYDDLISMKKASGRAQDLLDIQELRAKRELPG